MTPTVPLPPPHDVWTSCGQAYEAWGEGRVDFGSLVNGSIVLADGTRCPVEHAPQPLPVEVVVPPGQPYVRAPGELADTGPSLVWLGVALVLILAGLLFLVFTRPRKGIKVGQHSWGDGRDDDPYEAVEDPPGGGTGSDEGLFAAVTGLGETRDPGQDADGEAALLAGEQGPQDWDLRGTRDKDPQAPHPWRDRGTLA